MVWLITRRFDGLGGRFDGVVDSFWYAGALREGVADIRGQSRLNACNYNEQGSENGDNDMELFTCGKNLEPVESGGDRILRVVSE